MRRFRGTVREGGRRGLAALAGAIFALAAGAAHAQVDENENPPPPPPPKIDGPVLGIVYENTFGSRHEVVKRYGDRLEALYRAN